MLFRFSSWDKHYLCGEVTGRLIGSALINYEVKCPDTEVYGPNGARSWDVQDDSKSKF